MFLSNVFYSEIVHDKGERDGLPFVGPEARSVDSLKISVGGEPFAEEFVGEYPSLREAPYCTFHP